MRISGTSIKNSASDSIDQPCILKRERSEGGELAVELRRRCKTGRSSPGILFRRRSRSLAARLRSRRRRHGQYNCDSNWIGKNAAAAEREGKKGLERRMRRRLTQCAKEGREGGAAARQQKFASFPESLAWITEIDLAQKKGNLSLAAAASRTDETELLQCFVGSLSEGKRGARNQSSITICR